MKNGELVIHVKSAVMEIIALARNLIHEGAHVANMRNRPLQTPFFIDAD